MSEQDKTCWEIRELKNKIFISRATLVVGFLTVLFTVIGYFIDSAKTRDQQVWEVTSQDRKDKIARMNEIATEFDQLYGETLNNVNRNKFDLVWLRTVLDAYNDDLKEIDNPDEQTRAVMQSTKRLLNRLNEEEMVSQEFQKAVLLQERWRVKLRALTPDFEIHFGEDLQKDWDALATIGWDVINDEYNLFGSGNPDTEAFESKGDAFQGHLYEAIAHEKASLLELSKK